MQGQVVAFSADSPAIDAGALLVLVLVIVVWFVIVTAMSLRGGAVESPNRMAQMYGYTVCLVAVIVGLISVVAILNAAFDRVYPLQSEHLFGASLTSFEAYKATYARERAMMGPSNAQATDTASDAHLRERYSALVNDRLAAVRYRTSKTFLTSGLLLLIAAGLFIIHWRWLRRVAPPFRAAG